MLARKEKRLTPKQEAQAHMYALAGALKGDYIMARRLVELESLGRVLRSRFEGICSHPYCNEPPYLARTEKLVERAKEVINLLNGQRAISNYEINRDPRGPSVMIGCNAHHFRKLTEVAYSFESLLATVAKRMASAVDGSAFQ